MTQHSISKINELASRLATHDWTFSYADDYRVWKKGMEELQVIQGLIAELGDVGRDMYLKYGHKYHVPLFTQETLNIYIE